MKRCDYCGKEISYHEMYCCDGCQIETNKYYDKIEKFGNLFSILNAVCIFGVPIGFVLFSFWNLVGTIIISVCSFILGALLIFLPIPDENMKNKYKLKKALKILKCAGIAIIVFGFCVILFYLIFTNK